MNLRSSYTDGPLSFSKESVFSFQLNLKILENGYCDQRGMEYSIPRWLRPSPNKYSLWNEMIELKGQTDEKSPKGIQYSFIKIN